MSLLSDTPDVPGQTARQFGDVCRADLARRRRAGAAATAEEYLARFPTAFADAEDALALIYGEFLVREEAGESPDPADYISRFPEYAAALEVQFQLHAALAAEPTATMPTAGRRGARPALPGLELLDELGRGGAGVVYRARQERPDRLVAVKVLSAGAFAGADELRRFRAESEAAAKLNHPHIVQVHAVGEHDGRPYLVLEYVPGGTLADRLGSGPLPPLDAAGLVRTLAGAIDHAHQRGVLHRDLKPANILLAKSEIRNPKSEVRPAADAQTPPAGPGSDFELRISDFPPKVADFGLARRLDAVSVHTATGDVLGTPSYMAPEQAAGQAVGPAADVYALGAVLYECLTGRPPFRAATVLETLDQVRTREPVAVRQLQPGVPRDLETVCLKCLEKEPVRRYGSAGALANDLGRFLDGRPVLARPVGPAGRAWRWAKRNRAAAGLIAALIVGTTAASGLAAYALSERDRANINATSAATAADLATTEASRAEREADDAYRNQYLAHMTLAGTYADAGSAGQAAELVERYRTPPPHRTDPRAWEWHCLDQRSRLALRSLAGHTTARPGGFSPTTRTVSFSPDGSGLLTTGNDDTARLWDAATGRLRLVVGGPPDVTRAVYHPDGTTVTTTSRDGAVRLWDTADGRLRRTIPVHPKQAGVLAFSPDGRRLAVAGPEGVVALVEVESGQVVQRLTRGPGLVPNLAFDPAGARLAVAHGDVIHLWDVADGRHLRALTGHQSAVTDIAFHPDGRRLASSSQDMVVASWDVETGKQLRWYNNRSALMYGVAFSPDGTRLAAAGYDRAVRVWETETGRPIIARACPQGVPWDLAFSPDGAVLAASCQLLGTPPGPGVYLWELGTRFPAEIVPPAPAPAKVEVVAFADDRRLLVGGMGVIDTVTGRVSPAPAGLETFQRYHAAGHVVVTAGDEVRVVAGRTGQVVRTRKVSGPTNVRSFVRLSPDLRRAVIEPSDGRTAVYDLATGAKLWDLPRHAGVYRTCFSADGERLAYCYGQVHVCAAADGRRISGPTEIGMYAINLALSPDGTRVAVLGREGEAATIDAATGRIERTWSAHTGHAVSLDFTPDGRRLASTSFDNVLRLWDADSAHLLLSYRLPAQASNVAISPNGQRIAVGVEGRVLLFDGRPLTPEVVAEREALAVVEALRRLKLSPEDAAARVKARRGTPEAVRARALQILNDG